MPALMAALLGGQETTKLLKTLSLCSGPFFFQRRSNIRLNVNNIYRVLRRGHSLSGWMIPDFDCVVEGN